jgi:hypothetical protein
MAINIVAPASGATVTGAKFTAIGTCPANVPIYSYIAQQGGQPHIGQMTSSGPNFSFNFTGVPAGTGYSLFVQDNGNPPQQVVTNNITVT